jgi:hypothetical protein
MPVTKKTTAARRRSTAPAEDTSHVAEPVRAEAAVVPEKGEAALDTPSGHALAKVGAPDPDGDTEKERERGERYAAEKSKKRWGDNA